MRKLIGVVGREERALFSRAAVVACLVLGAAFSRPANGQSVSDVYGRVHLAVALVVTSGREIPLFGPNRPVQQESIGSGVLISADGRVMTAAHVVQSAERVMVVFPDNEPIPATVEASVPLSDVAMLRLSRMPIDVAPVDLGNSDSLEVGEQVFVVGAPLGATYSLTVGYVSARRPPTRMIGGLGLAEFIQTDAAINPGNSGGPMFNLNGEVVGIVSHILTETDGFQGLGFAVASNTARQLLIDSPSFWTGVQGMLLTDQLAASLHLPAERGLLVETVVRGSSGDRIGLRGGIVRATIEDIQLLLGGDIVLSVQGVSIGGEGSYRMITNQIGSLPSGGIISIEVWRHGERVTLQMRKP